MANLLPVHPVIKSSRTMCRTGAPGATKEEEEGFYILASQPGCVDVLGKVSPSQKL